MTDQCRESLLSLPVGAVVLVAAAVVMFVAYYTGDRNRGGR